ncbi:MAG: intermembrane transport protein PqiB [Phycisphaerae bacterium]
MAGREDTSESRQGAAGAVGGSASGGEGLPLAHIRSTPWRGWIWSVPLAAIILVGFLILRTWVLAGPVVHVTFADASGLNPRGTGVFCRGVQVGQLERVALTHHGRQVVATLSMDGSAVPFLRQGTRFFIQQPDLLAGNLAGLISGPTIVMLPGNGPPSRRFSGLLHAPSLTPSGPGKIVELAARYLGNLQRGAPVLYHGLTAGELLGWRYNPHHNLIDLSVFIRKPFDHRITPHTRFWRVGGLGLKTGPGGMHFAVPPLGILLTGGIAFAQFHSVPVAGTGPPKLYSSRSAARYADLSHGVRFAAIFPGSAGRLRPGAPVLFHGWRVGEVQSATFRYSRKSGRMVTSATLMLAPQRFGLTGERNNPAHLTALISRLVHLGLRAHITQSNLILGGHVVSLGITGRRTTGVMAAIGGLPELPTSRGASLGAILTSINHIAAKINAIPIKKIGNNVEHLSAGAAALADSRRIQHIIAHLDATLANIQAITAHSRGHVAATVIEIQRAARQAAQMMETMRHIAGGNYASQQSVRGLIDQLTRMARAIRSLANYLDAHPNALLMGRSK